MLRIELTEEQIDALRDVLHQQVSDLGMEIAATERLDFRDHLKQRRRHLNAILEALEHAHPQAA